jgi:peptide deformylase
MNDVDLVQPVLQYPNPFLFKELDPFDFNDPIEDPTILSHKLVQTMLKHSGLGLAASQIGINARVIAVSANPVLVMFNPKIVGESEDTNKLEEGCLSLKHVLVPVKRADVIRVRYTDPSGQTETKRYEGMTARIIQHEIDHLDGITILNRTSIWHKEKALKLAKQTKRHEKNGNYAKKRNVVIN